MTANRDLEPFCPRYHEAVELIGRRWSGAVLRALFTGATRFSDFRAVVPGLSDRLLSERLKELDRLKDDFVSTVTHELRTPLTSIRAFSEILRDDPRVDLAQRRKFLDIITKETERLTRLINQVLDLAKVESGKAEWHESMVDLKQVISDAVTAMEQLFQERRIRVDVRLPASVAPVLGDIDRIIQVLLNLLLNGVAHSPEGGVVELAARSLGAATEITVRDQGPGVPASERARVFEPLYSRTGGTGLGLAIVRRIADENGWLVAVGEAPGGGAEFKVGVPA